MSNRTPKKAVPAGNMLQLAFGCREFRSDVNRSCMFWVCNMFLVEKGPLRVFCFGRFKM
jgi:hypothetical protein